MCLRGEIEEGGGFVVYLVKDQIEIEQLKLFHRVFITRFNCMTFQTLNSLESCLFSMCNFHNITLFWARLNAVDTNIIEKM